MLLSSSVCGDMRNWIQKIRNGMYVAKFKCF